MKRLYIHVPFCLRKCGYCAFVSQQPAAGDLEEYVRLLVREMQLRLPGFGPVASLYLGGGTPSLLAPEQLQQLLDAAGRTAGIAPEAEITLEVNPGTVTAHNLEQFRRNGVNRLSIGIQSFDDHVLKLLGRIHDSQQARETIADARRAGFSNISIDLMHSLPGQSLATWRRELENALALQPEHLSVYGLTVEEGTPFADRYPEESGELPEDDLAAEMFDLAHELLTSTGYEHYEIASYARPGCRSRHNSGYWQRDEYVGLGVAAHSFLREGDGRRFRNPDTLDRYRDAIQGGRVECCEEQLLSTADAMAEYLFLGLRMCDGIELADFQRQFGCSCEEVYGGQIRELTAAGLLRHTAGRLTLGESGMRLSNQVFMRFL